MIDLGAAGRNLRLASDGVWRSIDRHGVDYPDEGNTVCFAVEDESWWFRHRNACLIETMRRFPPAGEVFDIGAGNGYVAAGLEQAGFTTTVVEPGAAGIRHARQRGLSRLIESTLQDAGFADETLPAVGMFDVVEHLPDDGAAFADLHRVMMPGARLYLTVPAFAWLWSGVDDLSGHHRRYTLGSLRERLLGQRFRVEWSTYFFLPLPLPILLSRTFPTLLGRGHDIAPPAVAESLKASTPVARYLTDTWSRAELAWLRAGHTLPFGSSCLVVARRT